VTSDRTGITILDGGMSRELMRLGAPFRQPEWSALALIEAPDTVREAHAAFARAGAQVLTTNAYAVVPFHLGDEGFARDGRRLAALSAELTRQAADEFAGVRVAGCVPPPLGSYRPDLFDADPTKARQVLEVLVEAQAPFVDLWLIETMSSIAEASLAIEVVQASSSPEPIWVAFTVDDDVDGTTLRSGESVSDATRTVASAGVAAVAFNCSQPEVLESSLRLARAATDLPLGVYANVLDGHTSAGANETVHHSRDDASPEVYADWADRWIDAGASIVGGCCGITSEYIEALVDHLAAE